MALKGFLFWLFFAALGSVVYFFYLGPPGAQFIQLALLGALLALSIIYLGLRASKLGKNFVTGLALCWLAGTYAFFGFMPSVDSRLLMLLLLVISLLLNAALSVVIRRRALH
jgi:hypothetical protein